MKSKWPDNNWEIVDPFHRKIYEKAKHLLEPRKNKIHTRISYHFALKLLQNEEGNVDIVIPAVLLHDTGYSAIPETELINVFGPDIKKPELQRIHETEGARMAGEILRSMNYPDEQIDKIQVIIDGHDSRSSALNQDDKIVKDADKLFRYSPEGFMIDSKRFNKATDDWIDYLTRHIKQWFFTDTAKQLALLEIRIKKERANSNW